MIFAGALWLLVSFAIVMPGMIARQLYGDRLGSNSDAAFPTLIRELIQPGLRGFVCAAIAGGVACRTRDLLCFPNLRTRPAFPSAGRARLCPCDRPHGTDHPALPAQAMAIPTAMNPRKAAHAAFFTESPRSFFRARPDPEN